MTQRDFYSDEKLTSMYRDGDPWEDYRPGDVRLINFTDKPQHVGVVVSGYPRTGWRHRWARRQGKFKTVEGNT